MAVIDRNKFINYLVWSELIDKATCGELKEAIEMCTVKDIYTKVDMVAMLDKIRAEIEQLSTTICTETRRIYIDSDDFKENVLAILDKYKAESEE